MNLGSHLRRRVRKLETRLSRQLSLRHIMSREPNEGRDSDWAPYDMPSDRVAHHRSALRTIARLRAERTRLAEYEAMRATQDAARKEGS